MNKAEAKKALLRLAAVETGWRAEQAEEYRRAERAFVELGFCPVCCTNGNAADHGGQIHLCDWEPGNQENYAGRACPMCEESFKCGEQPEYATEPDGHSDADPGLWNRNQPVTIPADR